ncbi:hypothetical protein Vretimale_11220, partial [Volvox reticuliferus]
MPVHWPQWLPYTAAVLIWSRRCRAYLVSGPLAALFLVPTCTLCWTAPPSSCSRRWRRCWRCTPGLSMGPVCYCPQWRSAQHSSWRRQRDPPAAAAAAAVAAAAAGSGSTTGIGGTGSGAAAANSQERRLIQCCALLNTVMTCMSYKGAAGSLDMSGQPRDSSQLKAMAAEVRAALQTFWAAPMAA